MSARAATRRVSSIDASTPPRPRSRSARSLSSPATSNPPTPPDHTQDSPPEPSPCKSAGWAVEHRGNTRGLLRGRVGPHDRRPGVELRRGATHTAVEVGDLPGARPARPRAARGAVREGRGAACQRAHPGGRFSVAGGSSPSTECASTYPAGERRVSFGRPGVNKGEQAAFPQVRVVAVAECSTHAIFDSAVGPYTTAENTMAGVLDRPAPARDVSAGRPGVLRIPLVATGGCHRSRPVLAGDVHHEATLRRDPG